MNPLDIMEEVTLQDCAVKTCKKLASFSKIDEFWISMNHKGTKSLSGIDIEFSDTRKQKD